MCVSIFGANVFALTGNLVSTNNAKDSSISGKIKTSATSTIKVLQPNSSSIWYITGRYEFKWNWTSMSSSLVDIFLYKGMVPKHTISNNFWNSYGVYTEDYTVPTDCVTGNDYKIFIQQSMNHSNNASSAPFTINASAFLNNCHTQSPAHLGEQVHTTWNGSAISVDIALYKSSTFVQTIVSGYESTSSSLGTMKGFTWIIPRTLAGGSDYQLKISAHGNSTVNTYSNYFTLVTDQTIFDVYIHSMVYATEIANVYWESWGNIQLVDLDLYNVTSLVQNIAKSVTNMNMYPWIVPTTLPNATYLIKVSNHNNPSSIFNSSNSFVFNATHAISNVYINSWVSVGSMQYIDWDSSPPVKSVDVVLYNGSSPVTTLASNLVNSGRYHWQVLGSYSTGIYYKIKIVDHDQASVYGFSSNFTINASKKIAGVSTPSHAQRGNVVNINWNTYGSIHAVDIKLYQSGSFVENIVLNEPNHYSYTWLIPSMHPLGGNYKIYVADHDAASDNANSSAFSITGFIPAKMPWGVVPGQEIKWTVGATVVLNFPDEFWNAIDTYLAVLGLSNVHSKDIYNSFKGALPNSWHMKADVESLVYDNSSYADYVIASMYAKENTNSTYAALGSYGIQFMQKMKNALGPVFSLMYPGDIANILPPVDFGLHIPIGGYTPSSAPYSFPAGVGGMQPSPIVPMNYSFSDNWNKMIWSLQNDSSFVSKFGSWSSFASAAGLTASANKTGIHASDNGLLMNKYMASIYPFSMLGVTPIQYAMMYASTFLHANMSVTSLSANASVNYNASMVLQKLSDIEFVKGKFTLPNGNSFDYSISVELYVYQGELSSITYLYHDPPTGLGLTTILIIVGVVGAAAVASVVVGVSVRRRRRA